MSQRKPTKPVAKGRTRRGEGGPSNYDDDPNAISKVLTKAFKADPSIENYVKLRRENATAEIEIHVIGNFDYFDYMKNELSRQEIEPTLVLRAMDADQEAISELSLLLLEKIIEAQAQRTRGEAALVRRGLAIPDKLIDWIISCCLDGLSWNDDLRIPRDLIVLIRERLGGSNREYEKAAEAHFNKGRAAVAAGSHKAQGGKPTYKMLGELFGVAPSTVKRWFKPGEFKREVDYWSEI